LYLFHQSLVASYLSEESISTPRHNGQLALGRLKELWPYWLPLWRQGPGNQSNQGERLIRNVLRSQNLLEFEQKTKVAFGQWFDAL
jgi:hypothetical protein